MKKTITSIIASVLAILMIFCFAGCNSSNEPGDEPSTKFEDIKGNEVLTESTSPNKTYTIKAYLNAGDEGSPYAVLCVVKENASGKERNIYYSTDSANANIQWSNDSTVVINGIVIDAKNGSFDSREHK